MGLLIFLVILSLLGYGVFALLKFAKQQEEKKNQALLLAGFRQNNDPLLRDRFQKTFGKLGKKMWMRALGENRLWYLLKDNDEGSDAPFFFLEPFAGAKLPTRETVFGQLPDNVFLRGTLKVVALLSGQKYTLNAPFPYGSFKVLSKNPTWSAELPKYFWEEFSKHPGMSLSFSDIGVRFEWYNFSPDKSSDLLDHAHIDAVDRVARAMLSE